MPDQNIVDVSWDYKKFDTETQLILADMVKVYEAAKKFTDFKIAPGSTGGFTELNAKVSGLATQIEKLATANTKLTKTVTDLEKQKQQQLRTDQQVIKTLSEEEKYLQQNIKTKQQQLTYEQALAKEKAKGASQATAEAKIAAQLTNEYKQLSIALKTNEDEYKRLFFAKGEDDLATKAQLKKTLEIRSTLDKLDGNLKNNQRNVGNYKSAFDGLGMSFTQVARELPSLTISAQQFFLAISNNLPMVFDEVGKARQEIAALKAQGEETPSLFSRIAKSAFSLQVGLSVLVTLLTLFGGKIVSGIASLFGYDDALEKADEATAQYQKAQLELIKTQEELNKLLADPINDVDRLNKTLSIYQALGKSRADTLEIEKKILDINYFNANKAFLANREDNGLAGFAALADYKTKLQDASDALNSTKKALSESGQVDYYGNEKYDKDAQKNLQKTIDRQQIAFDLIKQKYENQKKVVQDNFQFSVEYQSKLDEIDRYNKEQQLIRETESAKLKAQIIINSNERILADERNFEEKRIEAIESTAKARKKIAEAELRRVKENPVNKNENGTYTAEAQSQINEINKEVGFTIELEGNKVRVVGEIDKNAEVEKFKVREEFRKRRLAAEQEIQKAELGLISEKNKLIFDSDVNSFDKRIDAYSKYYLTEQQLIKNDAEFQKATKVMTSEELVALEKATNVKLIDLAIKAKKEVSDIFISSQQDELSTADLTDRLKLSKDELALYKSLSNKKLFAKKATQLELKQQKESINNQIYTDKEIVLSKLSSEEAVKAAQKRILENKIKLNQIELTEEQKKEAAKATISEIYFQIEQKGIDTFFSLYQKLSDAKFEKRIQQLEEEGKLIDENAAKEITAINNSTLSAQEKAAQITILTAKQAADKQRIEQKEKEEKIKQAKTDKAITIAKIIAETALAVVHQLTSGDPYTATARAILAGAIGAAELAEAIATPIPSYFKETDNHPGGPARFGEVPEVVTEPGRTPYIQWTETVGMLARGTKVKHLSSSDVMDAAGGAMVANMNERINIAQQAEAMRSARQDISELKDAIMVTGRMTIQALRKQKGANLTVNVNGSWGAKIERDIRG